MINFLSPKLRKWIKNLWIDYRFRDYRLKDPEGKFKNNPSLIQEYNELKERIKRLNFFEIDFSDKNYHLEDVLPRGYKNLNLCIKNEKQYIVFSFSFRKGFFRYWHSGPTDKHAYLYGHVSFQELFSLLDSEMQFQIIYNLDLFQKESPLIPGWR